MLALNADAERFYPFPPQYREETKPKPGPEPTNPIAAAADKLGSLSQTYTAREYLFLKKDLDDLKNHPDLEAFIMDIPVELALHVGDSKLSSDITEFEFKYSELDERVRDHLYKKRWYLFHGSKIGNWHSIIRNGIKNMSNSKFMTTGAAFGNGVYLTTNLNLAYAYGAGKKSSCVAVVEIMADPAQFKKTPEVYVIEDDTVILPRYIFNLKKSPKGDNKSLLETYQERRMALINCKTAIKRRDADLKSLTDEGFIVKKNTDKDNYGRDEDAYIISEPELHNDPPMWGYMYLDGYPFQPPLFFTINEPFVCGYYFPEEVAAFKKGRYWIPKNWTAMSSLKDAWHGYLNEMC